MFDEIPEVDLKIQFNSFPVEEVSERKIKIQRCSGCKKTMAELGDPPILGGHYSWCKYRRNEEWRIQNAQN